MKDHYSTYLCKPMERVDFFLYGKPVFIHRGGVSTYAEAYEMSRLGNVVINEYLLKRIRKGYGQSQSHDEEVMATVRLWLADMRPEVAQQNKSFWQKLKSFFY
jgi:hypothetical protein